MNFTFALSICKNKEWNAGEKPEEESLRNTSRVTIFLKNSDFTVKCDEFYFNAMVF